MKKKNDKIKYTVTFFQSIDSSYGDTPNVKNESSELYETTDKNTCLNILKDYTDYAEYELTEENVKKNFGIDNIKPKYMSQIKLYYFFRKILFGDLKKHVEDGIYGTFRYEIPDEVNSFFVSEEAEKLFKDKKERIYLSFIELKMEKT